MRIEFHVEDPEPPIAGATGAAPTNEVPVVADTRADTDAGPSSK